MGNLVAYSILWVLVVVRNFGNAASLETQVTLAVFLNPLGPRVLWRSGLSNYFSGNYT
jgi:hypothetical protein